MASRQLPPLLAFPGPSLCVQALLLSLPLLIRTSVLSDQGPTFTTSCNLSDLLKGPVSKDGGWASTNESQSRAQSSLPHPL